MMSNNKDLTQKILLVSFYVVHLYCFFFQILWPVGQNVAAKCYGQWNCARHIRLSEFGDYYLDLADGQWRDFRNSIILLACVAIGTSLLTRIVHYFLNGFSILPLRLLIGGIILFVQHRYHCIFVLGIFYGGYQIAHYDPKSPLTPYFIWLYGLFILFFKESYRIQHLSGWTWLQFFFNHGYGGMYRWHLPMNFAVLRMISYGMDHYWALHPTPPHATITRNLTHLQHIEPSTIIESETQIEVNVKEDPKYTDNLSCPLSDYTLYNYFAYLTYAPLYIAGPIISYNAFMKYANGIQSQVPLLPVIWYGICWLLYFILLEYCLSCFPFFAIMSSHMFVALTPLEMCVVLYVILTIMWLKFLLLWRFFRFWSLFDGVYCVENMTRCMSNNYSLELFWQHWHTSLNRWLIRYLYVPLGGRDYQVLSVWIIFFFVALWHDLEWKLLLWGAGNAIFYGIEIYVYKPLRKTRGKSLQQQIWVACFGAVYILILIVVNALGYAMSGGDEMRVVLRKVVSTDGVWTLLGSWYFLMIGVNIMFMYETLTTGNANGINGSSRGCPVGINNHSNNNTAAEQQQGEEERALHSINSTSTSTGTGKKRE